MKRILFIIFIVAFCLRIFAVVMQKESDRLPLSDAKQYDNIAVNIVSGYGFSTDTKEPRIPTAIRPPVYPLFLASVYFIFGHSYSAVKIVQAILGALFCIVIFFIASLLYNDKKIAIIASFLTAIYKPFVSGFNYYGGPALLFTEYLYMFIIGLAVLTLFLFIKNENKKLGALSGIFIASAILTRPEFALFPIVLAFYLFYLSKFSIKRLVKKFFILYFFIALTMLPWILRNYFVIGKFIPLSTYGGSTFLVGNNSSANGGWAFPEGYQEIIEAENLSEYEKNSIFLKKAIEELRNNTKRIPKVFIKKILVHWAPFEVGFKLFNFYYAVIFIFGSIGILFFRRRIFMEYILITLFLASTLAAVIIFGDPRYRYTFEAYLIIFAALAINEISVIIQKRFRLFKNSRK